MNEPEVTCLCVIDADGFAENVCDKHRMAMWQNEYRMRAELDAELDIVIRELAGRSPTRIERKNAPTGSFAVARPT